MAREGEKRIKVGAAVGVRGEGERRRPPTTEGETDSQGGGQRGWQRRGQVLPETGTRGETGRRGVTD